MLENQAYGRMDYNQNYEEEYDGYQGKYGGYDEPYQDENVAESRQMDYYEDKMPDAKIPIKKGDSRNTEKSLAAVEKRLDSPNFAA